jgi:prepilin-type N-terminal cleavage/methylation domain-containing protein
LLIDRRYASVIETVMLKSVFSRRAFTMVELLASIAIIAVIAALVFAFVGNYVDYARLTAARHTVAVLNESLNEYRTLGGISKAHSLEGTAGTTLNSSTLTDTVINAMKEGFTVGGAKKSFISANSTQLDTALIGTTGQGARLRFVVDTTEASGGAGSVPEEIEIYPSLNGFCDSL